MDLKAVPQKRPRVEGPDFHLWRRRRYQIPSGMMEKKVLWSRSAQCTAGLCVSSGSWEGNTFLSVYCWFCFSFIYESEM